MPNTNNGVITEVVDSVRVEEVVENVVCDYCDEKIEGEGYGVNGETWCVHCMEERSLVCTQCEERFNSDDMSSVGDDYLCGLCFRRHCSSCSNCGENYYENDGASCGCYDEEEEDEEGNGGDFSHRDIKDVLERCCNTIGIEIEAEGGNGRKMEKKVPKSCGIHHDGSLTNGAEVVTPPLNMSGVEDYIPIICNALTYSGYKATDNCGLHVHIKPYVGSGKIMRNGKLIGMEAKRAEVIAMVVRVMKIVEPILYSMLPSSRLSGRWSQELGNNNMLLSEVIGRRGKNIARVSSFERYVSDRYYGTNLCALRKYGTIEFRYHSGTVDAEKIIFWVRILDKIVTWSAKLAESKMKSGGSRFSRMMYNNGLEVLSEIEEGVGVRGKLKGFASIMSGDREIMKYIGVRIAKFKGAHGVGGAKMRGSGRAMYSSAICDRRLKNENGVRCTSGLIRYTIDNNNMFRERCDSEIWRVMRDDSGKVIVAVGDGMNGAREFRVAVNENGVEMLAWVGGVYGEFII